MESSFFFFLIAELAQRTEKVKEATSFQLSRPESVLLLLRQMQREIAREAPDCKCLSQVLLEVLKSAAPCRKDSLKGLERESLFTIAGKQRSSGALGRGQLEYPRAFHGLPGLRLVAAHAWRMLSSGAAPPTTLGVDSPFFSTIVLFKNRLFPLGFWLPEKKDAWKELGRYP